MVAHNPEALQLKPRLPNYGVIDDIFYNYNEFIAQFKVGFPMEEKLYVDSASFKSGEAWKKVVIGKKGRRSDLESSPRARAIIPFWTSTLFGNEAVVKKTVARMVNALTTTNEGKRPPLVEEVMGVAPFIDMRQEKDGPGDGKGDEEVGEANEVELTARDLTGMKKLLVLCPHSYEGLKKFKKIIKEVLPVTATPLYAEHIQRDLFEKHIIEPENTRIVALDKGSLQQCITLSEQLGLPPSNHIIAFDKSRKGHNMVGKLILRYGDPADMIGKDMIIYDDIIDTFGSMTETCKLLREKYKCNSITIIGTHGVLSHPARGNIIDALEPNGSHVVVDRLIMSDSLSKPNYAFDGIEGVTIIPVATMMGKLAHLFADVPLKEMKKNKTIKKFILDPKNKDLVWEEFKEQYATLDKIHDPIQTIA